MNTMIWIGSKAGIAGSIITTLLPLTKSGWLLGTLGILPIVLIGYGVWMYRKLKAHNTLLKQDLDDEKLCIEQLSHEKEWLMREIHHRVKNNLQIMMSLLNMQSSYLSSHEAKLAIRSNSHRLFAISMVHQKLYQTESLSSIDMQVYLRELAQYLQYEFDCTERVILKIHVEPLYLDAQTAIPLGLIVNEALSNTFRHGFPDAAKGMVNIHLRSEDAHQYLLQITDDGVGLPEGYDNNQQTSLGQSLMLGLSRQLRGKLTIQNNGGVVVNFLFPQEGDAMNGTSAKAS